jgi:predicted O-linked N-acetylglucosamine transferase (SPINDLY family)
MRILQRVDRSVLFLYGENRWARRISAGSGSHVDPDRIVFGPRLPPAEYLARYRAADLFLDTLPYNAGTTANDALWAGLPVLTLAGETFAGRVAASLLHAIGLPELIAHSQQDYEALAIDLGTYPDRMRQIREKLARNRLSTPLFDTPRFARNLEAAYIAMHERHKAGLPPEHIHVTG